MNTTQKTASASAFGVFCILAPAILLVGFGIIDLHFVLRGKTAIATIESSSKEFAGFSNDDVTGTQPTYRYRITYSFDANGTHQRGERTSDALTARAKTVPVQYIENAPKRHRFLTPSIQCLRLVYWIGLTLSVMLCVLDHESDESTRTESWLNRVLAPDHRNAEKRCGRKNQVASRLASEEPTARGKVSGAQAAERPSRYRYPR